MGYEKDRQIEEWDQGWRFTNTSICSRCLSDKYLQELVDANASRLTCSYCKRKNRKNPISIPFDDIMEVVGEAIFREYAHCEDETIAWDKEAEEYVGQTFDTNDLVYSEIPTPSDEDQVMQDIVEALGDYEWCEKNPYSLTGEKLLFASWEEFCSTVKHGTRYFFDSADEPSQWSETIPVGAMLNELRDVVSQFSLASVLPQDTEFHRFRQHDNSEICDSWDKLGSPPPEKAVSNRMSAAGISVFYAGLDFETARAETAGNLEPTDNRSLTAAKWRNTRPLNILDLTDLPTVPNFYDRQQQLRSELLFLHMFMKDITKPVEHDGREHIDYVPTQILTEYFRLRFEMLDKQRLDGILYPSAKRVGGKSIIIFASYSDLDPTPDTFFKRQDEPMLKLDCDSIRTLSKKEYPAA